ncbi:hypothetical protein L6452_44765 [Arctium lappa]|nr:hypothetical protein L6452_44765 [Arctium lappa]
MDKSWMRTNRMKKPYIDGVATFFKYVVHQLKILRNIDPENTAEKIHIPCPCVFCLNHYTLDVDEVDHHLFSKGIDPNYTNWTKHGEMDEPSRSTHVERELAISLESIGENLRDAYDDVDEEFSTIILPQNDNIMPLLDPLDLGKESRDDYFRTNCRGSTGDHNSSLSQLLNDIVAFHVESVDLLQREKSSNNVFVLEKCSRQKTSKTTGCCDVVQIPADCTELSWCLFRIQSPVLQNLKRAAIVNLCIMERILNKPSPDTIKERITKLEVYGSSTEVFILCLTGIVQICLSPTFESACGL